MRKDIEYFHAQILAEKDFLSILRLIRYCLIPLQNLKDSFGDFNAISKEDVSLIEKKKTLNKKLSFINHLRNKISGHLDARLIEKAIQWEPTILLDKYIIRDDDFFINKGLLEAGINSYLDSKDQQIIFGQEVDLIIEHNILLNFIYDVNTESITWLKELEEHIIKHIEIYNSNTIMDKSTNAGLTDFNLKK
ncbi:hypothetical protein [Pontibacter vulgaris]|uniref:hypothetical protein n=1 Tax=Pontibacter vulgaris TaxID=2905679 RepID=UPI001FA6E76A|nr:hypothetical protein [Pontibacter vulgaris]